MGEQKKTVGPGEPCGFPGQGCGGGSPRQCATLPLAKRRAGRQSGACGKWEASSVSVSVITAPATPADDVPTRLEHLCQEKGLKMTEQRRVISRVLSEATDHPDVEMVYRRAVEIDPHISIATVYRTMRLFEEANVIEKLDFGDGRARFEENRDSHHHHLIDLHSGEVIEFQSPELEILKEKIARELGYELIGHRLELYGVRGKTV